MITRDTLVIGTLPRVSPQRFAEVLADFGSPAAGEAAACYRAVAAMGVDPLFALAVFEHESNFGLTGICKAYDTRSPGNTRSTRTGTGEIISTERGPFVRYPSWPEGFRDLAYRLIDPTYCLPAEPAPCDRRDHPYLGAHQRWQRPRELYPRSGGFHARVGAAPGVWTRAGDRPDPYRE